MTDNDSSDGEPTRSGDGIMKNISVYGSNPETTLVVSPLTVRPLHSEH